jgi:hypothetical protein
VNTDRLRLPPFPPVLEPMGRWCAARASLRIASSPRGSSCCLDPDLRRALAHSCACSPSCARTLRAAAGNRPQSWDQVTLRARRARSVVAKGPPSAHLWRHSPTCVVRSPAGRSVRGRTSLGRESARGDRQRRRRSRIAGEMRREQPLPAGGRQGAPPSVRRPRSRGLDRRCRRRCAIEREPPHAASTPRSDPRRARSSASCDAAGSVVAKASTASRDRATCAAEACPAPAPPRSRQQASTWTIPRATDELHVGPTGTSRSTARSSGFAERAARGDRGGVGAVRRRSARRPRQSPPAIAHLPAMADVPRSRPARTSRS